MNTQTELMQPAIDRLEIRLAGEAMTLHQASIRILGRMLNFIEEDRLSDVARMLEDHRIQTADIEAAFNSWATSSGAKSFRYFLAIIERKTDQRKQHTASQRPAPQSPAGSANEITFADPAEADSFQTFLILEEIAFREVRRDGACFVYAPNVKALYATYKTKAE